MIKLQEDVDLRGYTFVLPSVAVGNVGQLSVDLLISSLGLKRIGFVWNSALIPIVGADPYDETGTSTDLCTSADLFCGTDVKIVVLQIRSPPSRNPTQLFGELQRFVTEKNIAKVVILTSSYAHEKRDRQITTTPLRYIASRDVAEEYGKLFGSLNWIHLEPKIFADGRDNGESFEIPGGGFAKSFYDALASQTHIPCAILLRFCSEGDNIPDALELTNYLNEWLDLLPKQADGGSKIRYPPSWKFLFGNPPPREIY